MAWRDIRLPASASPCSVLQAVCHRVLLKKRNKYKPISLYFSISQKACYERVKIIQLSIKADDWIWMFYFLVTSGLMYHKIHSFSRHNGRSNEGRTSWVFCTGLTRLLIVIFPYLINKCRAYSSTDPWAGNLISLPKCFPAATNYTTSWTKNILEAESEKRVMYGPAMLIAVSKDLR